MAAVAPMAKGEEMLAKHRQALILQEVQGAGSARVSELTLRLGVFGHDDPP
jgi:hypothetical protein